VCKPQTGWNTYFYLNTVFFVCSDSGPVNFAFYPLSLPGPLLSLLLCHELLRQIYLAGALYGVFGGRGGQVALMTN